MKTILIFIIITLTGLAGLIIWYSLSHYHQTPITPLSSNPSTTPFKPQNNPVIYGFLPYWNYQHLENTPLEKLTHLSLFGLTVDENGEIVKLAAPGESDPGWWRLKPILENLDDIRNQYPHLKVHVVFTSFDDDTIKQILSNEESSNRLINNIIESVIQYNLDGVNVDFEPTGAVSEATRNNYINFLQNLNLELKSANPDSELVIDIYPNAASNQKLWPVDRLAKHVDYVVVMAYDYHRPGSPVAGPIAPLYPADETATDHSIVKDIAALNQYIPTNQLLLGIPFYGYQWQTTSLNSGSKTYPKTGQVLSYTRIKQLLQTLPNLNLQWDSNSLSPKISYESDDTTFLIQYENPRSLQYKLDLVKQSEIAGIAIWALGYEGQDQQIWNSISP